MDGLSLVLPSTLAAPRSAREALDELVVPVQNGLRAKLGLLVGELVVSALKREPASIQVEVTRLPQWLRVEVRDQDERGLPPSAREARLTDGGWSMFLIRRLADRWGVAAESAAVWFELDLPEARRRPVDESLVAAATA